MMVEENNIGEKVQENTKEIETFHKERMPRSRERGHDRKPRTLRVNSMRNLSQFSGRPQEFETYLKEEKGIDIAGKTSAAKMILIVVGIMLAVLVILYLCDRYRNRQHAQEC